ncbi:MAG TPA: phosphoenolpyruvate--protein phosphotransferase [Gemmataceae bacterium]|nr:phosphoenolpyruvate--protein phosphotransferase [Gemmataceae bacterium]
MRKGVPVSPGVAVAPAYCVDEVLARREPQTLDVAVLSDEVARFDSACTAAARELDAIAERVSKEVGDHQAAIFRAHRLLLRDPALVSRVKSAILGRHVDARTALHELLEEYAKLFAQIQDEYLKERMADIRDVVGRIMAHLALQDGRQIIQADEPVILIAPEILPSQAMMFDRLKLAGILTETGGTTGHAAILARSMGIPAVSGLRGILREAQTGDLVAVDGREGHVYLRPGPEVEAAYRKLQREYFDLRDRLIENRDQEPISADGIRIELLANVNNTTDAVMANKVGASGVGLYRTEYLFLTHPTVPDEEEQLQAYRAVIEAAPNKSVTIRTLDLGADKHVPYLGDQREANPFMGWRSIRLATAYPEFFQTQLRAILRAGRFGKVSLLFPMISTLEEVQRLKRVVQRTRKALRDQGLPSGDDIALGIMIEVPAAALCIDALLDEVHFVSIGSNDLIQYVMAADRDNPKVAHLCEPFSPAIFRLLHQVIKACNERGKPVTLCGEMAGRPRCVLPLFGLGLRSLSMSPAFVPSIKEALRCTTESMAQEIARRVLRMTTVGEVRGYLTRKIRKLCPNVSLLDMRR